MHHNFLKIIIYSILLIISVMLFGCGSDTDTIEKAPDFTLKGLSGNSVSLQQYRGRVVLLDFWATWCVPCRKAMPHMQELFDKFKPKEEQDTGGLELFGISLDKKGSKIVKPFFARLKKFTYPMLADPTNDSSEKNLIRKTEDMQSNYKVQGIPVVYVFDSKGIISHVHVGIQKKDMAELDDTIKELISEK